MIHQKILGLTRRQFLGSASIFAVVAGIKPGVVLANDLIASTPVPKWVDAILRITDARQMISIGEAYLATTPRPSDARALISALEQGSLASVSGGSDTTQIQQCLTRAIRADFAANRVAVVRGWWLSRTEAQVCGLAALLGREA